MSYTEDQLWELLREAVDMPYGAAQIALLEQVVAHADAARLEDLRFQARMRLTAGYTYGGEPAKSFVTFSWCLTEFDRDPDHYARSAHTVLWNFKSMVNALRKFPEIPLQRTYAVLDDMERRWREAGNTMHAVYTYRHIVAAHIGDLVAAEDWYRKWITTPRDSLSDCIGCDPTTKVWWLTSQGQDEDAIALAGQVLSGTLTCSEQPQAILTAILLPYVRTGRLDEARDAHRRAYRVVRNNLADLGDIATHIEFCAVTGNEARGLEIVERHLPWLDSAPTPYAAMEFAGASALLLRRIVEVGQGGVLIRRPAHGNRASADLTAEALGAELTEVATALAARFDARNGTDHQSTLVRAILDAQPIVAALPLSAAVGAARPPEEEPAPPPNIPAAASADELLDLADHYLLLDDLTAVAAVENAFDDRYAGAELTLLQRGRRADVRGLQAANTDDEDAVAEIAWTSALDLFAAAGDEIRHQATRARLGLLMCKTDRANLGLPIAQDATDYLVASAPVTKHCGAHRRLAFAYMLSGRPEDALASLDLAAATAAASDDPHAGVRIPVERAGILAQSGRVDEAAVVAEEARDACRSADYRPGIAATCWILGRVAQNRRDLDSALAAYDEALSAADKPQFKREIRRQRAIMLATTSHAAAAIDDLIDEVGAATSEGEDEAARIARFHLAGAYLNTGRALDAADLLEEILRSMEPEDTAAESVRHMLSNAFRVLDQPDQAIEQLTLIAESGSRRDSLPLVGEMNEQIGELLDKLDRDSIAATHFAASARAYREAGSVLEAVRAGRRAATSHMWARQMDQAVEALDVVDRIALDLDNERTEARWERAMLFVDGARVLAQHGDLNTAIIRCAPAIGILVAVGDRSSAAFAQVTYGEFLVRADRPAEAEPALRAAFAEGGNNGNVRIRAAQALAYVLGVLGRDDEAAQFRAVAETDE